MTSVISKFSPCPARSRRQSLRHGGVLLILPGEGDALTSSVVLVLCLSLGSVDPAHGKSHALVLG